MLFYRQFDALHYGSISKKDCGVVANVKQALLVYHESFC